MIYIPVSNARARVYLYNNILTITVIGTIRNKTHGKWQGIRWLLPARYHTTVGNRTPICRPLMNRIQSYIKYQCHINKSMLGVNEQLTLRARRFRRLFPSLVPILLHCHWQITPMAGYLYPANRTTWGSGVYWWGLLSYW